MPKISSDLTSKSYAGPSIQEFNIPDESEHNHPPAVDFEALDAQRQARGLPALDEATKRALYASQAQEKAHKHVPEEPIKHLADFERQMGEVKRAKQTGRERLTASAKARIEALCGMSQGLREVSIDGNKYLLRTLKGKEHRAAIVAASEFDGSAHAAFEVRKQLLARAIAQVADYDVELFLGDDSVEARLEFVDELDEPVLIKLYSEYLDLAQSTQNKYFVKTEADAKEVMEDLKK